MFKPLISRLLMFFIPLFVVSCNVPQYGVLSAEPLTPDQAIIQSTIGRQIALVLPTLGVGSPYVWGFEPLPENAPVRFIEEKSALSRYPERAPENYAPDRVFVFEAVSTGSLKVTFKQQLKAEDKPSVDNGSDVGVQRTFQLEVR